MLHEVFPSFLRLRFGSLLLFCQSKTAACMPTLSMQEVQHFFMYDALLHQDHFSIGGGRGRNLAVHIYLMLKSYAMNFILLKMCTDLESKQTLCLLARLSSSIYLYLYTDPYNPCTFQSTSFKGKIRKVELPVRCSLPGSHFLCPYSIIQKARYTKLFIPQI